MNDTSQIPFPYKRPVVKINQTSHKINLKEGIKRPIEKYAWMSEGGLKPIEKGLPLIFGTKFSHSFEDVELAHKRFTNFVTEFKKFKAGDEYDESIDIDENEENEKKEKNEETEKNDENDEYINQNENDIEMDKIYNPFKFITDRVASQKNTTEDTETLQTGINTSSTQKKSDPKASIIDTIKPIKFSSVKPSHEIKKPLYMSPFYHPQYEAKSKVRTKSTVPLLEQQIKRVFKPDGAPFENVDKSEDFPTTMLLPMIDENNNTNKRGRSELSILKQKNRIINPKNDKKYTKKPQSNLKKLSFPNDGNNDSPTLLITEMRPDMYSKDTFINDKNETDKDKNNNYDTNQSKSINKYDDLKDVPSTLIDPTKDDVFWTKNKVPFTRDDINHIFSWQIQNEAIMTMVDEKRQKKLDEREKALMTTFESKEAFAHAIDLVDKECQRIVKLGPGKSIKNKKSFWIEAAKYAKKDKSSLKYRKKKWDEFMKEIQNSFNLLVNKSKEDNIYSSPNSSSLSESNANLNADLNASSSNSIPSSKEKSEAAINDNKESNDNNDNKESNNCSNNNSNDDFYSENILIENKPPFESDTEKNNGLMKNQVDFILRYKAVIMSGKELNSSAFWKVIELFQAVDFTHTEFCILVEILRFQLGVTKSEVITYLEDKDYPVMFYHLASTNPEYQPITGDDPEITPKSNKKKKKEELFSTSTSSMIFNTMQKKQQILENQSPHKSPSRK